MPTLLLLIIWTLWLPLALLLLDNWRGVIGAILFLALAVALWAKTDITWRSYLMASLIAHVAIAVPYGQLGRWHRRLGPYWQAAVSVIGLVWLWVDGGAAYWPYVVGILLLIGLAAAGGYLLWRVDPAFLATVADHVRRRARRSTSQPSGGGPPSSQSEPSRPPPIRDTPARVPAAEQSAPHSPPEPVQLPDPDLPGLQPRAEPEPPLEPELPEPDSPRLESLEAEPLLGPEPPSRPELPLVPSVPRAGGGSTDRYPEPISPDRLPSGVRILGGELPAGSGDGITFDLLPGAEAPGGTARSPMRLTPRLWPAVYAGFEESTRATVPVCGLARFFPAGTRHGRRSTAAPGEDPCELTDVDHVHVHRVSAPFAQLFEPTPRAASILAALAGSRSLAPAAAAAHVPAPADPALCLEVTTVVLGPDPPPGDRVSTAYISEDTLLPVLDLLASSEELCCSLADALAEKEPGEHLATFLRALLVAGSRHAELALIPRPTQPPDGTGTAIFGLFGCAVTDPDRAVLLGAPAGDADGWEALRVRLVRGEAAAAGSLSGKSPEHDQELTREPPPPS